jgi:hypothetical protein
MPRLYKPLLFLLLFPLVLQARKVAPPPPTEGQIEPWFTGPLLTPAGGVIPYGHQNYEPYFYWTTSKGHYDEHWHSLSAPHFKNFLFQPLFQFGILPATQFDIFPEFIYNNTQGEHAWRVSDIPGSLSFALLRESPHNSHPAIRLRFGFNIPVGKYQKLNPLKLGTDDGGTGDWNPAVGIVMGRHIHLKRYHFFAWHTWINYTFTIPVPVHGLSFYGGAPTVGPIKGTRGTVYPGSVFLIMQGFEYSLNRNWALALDVVYTHVNRRRFSGYSPLGTKPIAPSSELFTIAPGLEYNFSENVGLIGGPWFSIAGRNRNFSTNFISWIFAINIYH